jgi:hypothetical protein
LGVRFELVSAVSWRFSGVRERTTSIIAMTEQPMVPGGPGPDGRNGPWPVGSPFVPPVGDMIIGRSADCLCWAQHDLGMAMFDVPSGTITFLFTDIEGSTTLFERDRQAMAADDERHNVLLDAAIQAHGGIHFKTIRDAVSRNPFSN